MISQPLGLETFNLQSSEFINLKSRQLLPEFYGYCWKIEAGWFRTITYLEDGRVSTLGLWKTGDIIGRPFSHLASYAIESLTRGTARRMKTFDLSSGVLNEAFIKHIIQHEKLLIIRSRRCVEERILLLLKDLAVQENASIEGFFQVRPYLTHEDFANILTSTRCSVTRALTSLEAQNIVKKTHKRGVLLLNSSVFS